MRMLRNLLKLELGVVDGRKLEWFRRVVSRVVILGLDRMTWRYADLAHWERGKGQEGRRGRRRFLVDVGIRGEC